MLKKRIHNFNLIPFHCYLLLLFRRCSCSSRSWTGPWINSPKHTQLNVFKKKRKTSTFSVLGCEKIFSNLISLFQSKEISVTQGIGLFAFAKSDHTVPLISITNDCLWIKIGLVCESLKRNKLLEMWKNNTEQVLVISCLHIQTLQKGKSTHKLLLNLPYRSQFCWNKVILHHVFGSKETHNGLKKSIKSEFR